MPQPYTSLPVPAESSVKHWQPAADPNSISDCILTVYYQKSEIGGIGILDRYAFEAVRAQVATVADSALGTGVQRGW